MARAAPAARGFPNLVDDDWMWGGNIDQIHTTIQHGIRNTDDKSRQTLMPRFGVDGMLTAPQVAAVDRLRVEPVGPRKATPEGAKIWQEQCVACHQADGKGNQELGAPNLDRRHLALWRRSRLDLPDDLLCPQRQHAGLGRAARRGHDQDAGRSTSTRWAADARRRGAMRWMSGSTTKSGLAAHAQGGAAALRHAHQGLSARGHGPVAARQMGGAGPAARPSTISCRGCAGIAAPTRPTRRS